MIRVPLLSLPLLFATQALAQDLSLPKSFYGFGDPTALAVDAAELRAYVGEGAAVSILDLAVLAVPLPPAAVLARVPVDASVVGLQLDEPNQRLLIAGGSFGLLDMALGGARAVTARDDVGDKVCFQAVLATNHVLAVFGARNASELRLYDRTTLAFVASAALPAGTAFAAAVDGTFAYVAMGTGGICRVDFANPGAPVVQPGPVFPTGVFGEPARVRDIAVAGVRIYAAADGHGLVSWRTSVPFGPGMTTTVTPLTGPATGGGTATLYAHEVAVNGTTVLVGGNRVAGREADGGPYTSYGPMNYAIAVGGVVTPGPLAAADALYVFNQGATGLSLVTRVDLDGAFRELIARPSRIFAEHLGLAFQVRPLATPATVLASHKGIGNAPAEALVSLRDPDVVISGQDSAGTVYSGLLDIGNPFAIAPIPGTNGNPGLGLWFDAQWPDAAPSREWFVGNGNDTWRLHRFDAAAPAQGDYWELPSPDDPLPGFNNGRNYFLSWLDGDLLLLTRGGTRYGLVGYSKAAVVAATAGRPRGSTLVVPVLFQLETHFLPEGDSAQTWRCRTFALPSGQRIAAIAAGFNTEASPNGTRPQIVLYDVSAGTAAVPALLARVVGPNLEGNAMAVEAATIGGVTYLFVADFGFGVHVYDVSVPGAPVLAGGWQCPPNPIDNLADHPSDLVLDRAADGRLYAYVTAWRRGLVRLDVTNPASFNLPVVAERDTPGLPYGIALRNASGARGLVLADHQAGLRLYGEYSEWEPVGGGCAGASGVPALSLVSPPSLGGTFALSAQNLAGGLAFMVTGLFPQNVPLQPFGFGFGPTCALLVTTESVQFLVQSGGAAGWSMAVPASTAFAGVGLWNQVIELSAPSAVSNAGHGVVW